MSKATQFVTAASLGLLDQLDGDSGSATPAGGAITIAGGNNITTSAAASTVTVSLDALTDGQLFIGDTGNPATAATLTAGTGINIANAAGSITISATDSVNWEVVTMATGMAVDKGYIANAGGGLAFTLPAVVAVGDTMRITGINAGGWTVAQNAGQTVHFGISSTTTGVGGSLASTATRDSIELVCVVANTDFNVTSSVGNITIV